MQQVHSESKAGIPTDQHWAEAPATAVSYQNGDLINMQANALDETHEWDSSSAPVSL